MKPGTKCVIITGRPGSGKSTLSRKLHVALHMPLVSRDEIKEGLVSSFGVSHDALPPDTNREATGIFFSVVQMLLDSRVSLVVEAAFQHRVWETVVPGWARVSDVSLIVCEVDADLAARRHLQRALEDPTREFFHGDRSATHFKEPGAVLPPGEYLPPAFDLPTLKVDTTDGYDPDVAAIKDFIRSEDRVRAGVRGRQGIEGPSGER
jgi:predicted kinase